MVGEAERDLRSDGCSDRESWRKERGRDLHTSGWKRHEIEPESDEDYKV